MATIKTIETTWEENGITGEALAEQKAARDYIVMLGSRSNVDVKRWHLDKCFSDDEIHLVTDKRELNKRFFAKLQERNEAPEVTDLEITDETINTLLNAAKQTHERRVRELRNSAESQKRAMDDLQTRFFSARDLWIRRRNEIEVYESATCHEDRVMNAVDSIKAEVEKGYWQFIAANGSELWFFTKTDVVMQEGNALQVTLGKFAVKLDLISCRLFVYPYKDNKSSDGFFHPYVDTEGEVCWGDSQRVAFALLDDWKFGEALGLLQALLNTYGSGTPFVRLSRLGAAGPYRTIPAYMRAPTPELYDDEAEQQSNEAEPTLPQPRDRRYDPVDPVGTFRLRIGR